MKRYLALLGTLFFAFPATAAVWNAGTWEIDPADSDAISEGAARIRETRAEKRFRAEVGHHFGSDNTNDNGMHLKGSARCFFSSFVPIELDDRDGADNSDGSDYDQSGTSGSTQNLLTETSSQNGGNGGTENIGEGRCWVDSDTFAIYIHDGNRWNYAGQNYFDARNLLFNGSFEQGTGTAVPDGWTLVGPPGVTYGSPPVSEGTGGQEVILTASAADEGLSQTFSAPALKASTRYRVIARARPNVALDSCSIRTTGGAVNASATIATGAVYVTLSSAFETDAVPTPVVVIVEADANTDVCGFDSVMVFEEGATGSTSDITPTNQPSVIAYQTQNTTQTAATGAFATLVSVAVTPPGDNYIAVIMAHVSFEEDTSTANNDSICLARIHDGTTELAVGSSGLFRGNSDNSLQTWGNIALHYVTTTPLAAGTTVTYTLQIKEEGTNAACSTGGDGAGVETAESETNTISVLLMRAD